MKAKFNPWPYGIVLVFVLLFCGLATVVVIAATHRDSMVSENYYEQELKFQDQIDSTARAQKCGAQLRWDTHEGKLIVAVPAAQLAQQFSGTIEFYRPSSADLDRSLELTPGTDGSQTVDVSSLKSGPWRVRAHWVAAGQSYFLEQKITL